MTENETSITPEMKEGTRAVALKNLKNKSLVSLATVYHVDRSKAYGEAGDSVVENYLYFPAINSSTKFSVYDKETKSEKEVDLMRNAILGSREDGRRYSGHASEHGIIKSCAAIVEESLPKLQVKDVLELIGSDKTVKPAYQNKYLSDLEAGNEEEKKMYNEIKNDYMHYLIQSGVADAFKQDRDSTKSGLEKKLAVETH